MPTHPGDVLSAASLLATVVALLYSLWYPEMRAALAVVPQLHVEDRMPAIDKVRGALRMKALPLVIASVVQLLVFGPDAIGAVPNIITLPSSLTPSGFKYDSVQAAFVAVYAVSALLAGLAITMAIGLWQKLKSLRTK